MSETISLKGLERKAYRSFFQDGIWDIYLGLLLLTLGGGPALLTMGATLAWAAILPLALCALAMTFFFAAKKFITIPRLGTVQFGPARTLRKKRTALVLAASALVGVLLLLARLTGLAHIPVFGAFPLPIVVFAANCIIIFSLAAYYLDFSRLYAYGLLYAAAFPLAVVPNEHGRVAANFLVAYALSAGPMILIGSVLLIRFLRDYPVPARPEPNREA